MGLGDYPNFLSSNERHLGSTPVPRKDHNMSEVADDTKPALPTSFELQEFKLTTGVEIAFNAEDIVSNINRQDILALVADLDNEVGEWEFTILLYHYFREQFAIAQTAVPELVGLSEDELLEKLRGMSPVGTLGEGK